MKSETIWRCIIEYDGTEFAGWQIQPGQRTVQGAVEDSIARILGERVRVVAAGRTDAGVHALGQVISFSTASGMSTRKMLKAFNAVLPDDVTVVRIDEAPVGFDARYDACARTYRYTISHTRCSIGRSYKWRIRYPVSHELLAEATRPLVGKLDLRGFSKRNEDDDYRTIVYKNDWTFKENEMIFEITAIRFFHHTVRSIVGSAVEVARGKEKPDLLERIIITGDRSLAGPTAPACGLCLVHVEYEDTYYGK
jgi:tRNA pseudouridine38-40 synthase